MPEPAGWLIVGLPLTSFVVATLIVRPFWNTRAPRLAGYLTVAAVAGSFGISLWALQAVAMAPEHQVSYPSHVWFQAGELTFSIGLLMNSLTVIMLLVVSFVSLMVQIYSQGYMRGDPGYVRYFAFMSLFTASMLGLVLANNLVLLFVFWELVGLCSYLLIGFWYQRPAAAAAAKKAFIVTRFGDFGFLLAILLIFFQTGTLEIVELYDMAGTTLAGAALTWVALGIFAGAVGKSAQFPLHVWLPDAMEGPTPVSALIHAATMVAAGVFLVARFFPLFEASPTAMTVVALVGATTALIAALLGMVMFDIKRVLAYSTMSQLGYMMMALGVGAYGAALFHLFNHAFFKALLFLGAGSVNHATGTFDMRLMGGLRRAMPWTTATFLIATLSIVGIPPFSGFFSKEEILGAAWGRGGMVGQAVFWVGVTCAFMTAFYMLRALLMTFGGEYRGGETDERGSHEQPHESPLVMVLPLALLAVPSALSWLANVPGLHQMADFLAISAVEVEAEAFNLTVAGLSGAAVVVGLLLAYGGYSASWFSPARVVERLGPIYTFLVHKYYLDELYEDILVRKGLYRGVTAGLNWADGNIVDRVVDGVAWTGRNVGQVLKRLQTGQTQVAAVGLSLGLLIIYAAFLFFGAGR